MLKVECPKCSSWIHLYYRSADEAVKCPSCSSEVPAKDVYVSAGPYLISRDVLLKNMYKYRRLLAEAESDFMELKCKGERTKPFDLSAKTIDMFITHLREMLDGCRESLRHRLGGLGAECLTESGRHAVSIKDISVTGARVLFRDALHGLKQKDVLSLSLGDGEAIGSFSIEAQVVWKDSRGEAGVRFVNVSAALEGLLQAFILEKAVAGADLFPMKG